MTKLGNWLIVVDSIEGVLKTGPRGRATDLYKYSSRCRTSYSR